jgi:uncharacterized membrane protein
VSKGRLEAFSDGVIAILITIMVLELDVPHGTSWASIEPVVPALVAYVLSFLLIGIYWNNHHHMLHATERVNGRILWANLHLLFWLSLIPFATAWMGENGFAAIPTAAYGVILVLCAISYTLLQRSIIKHHGPHSRLASAVGSNRKEKVSLALYISGVPLAFVHHAISLGLYFTVALIWLVPDRRFEAMLDAPSRQP